MDTQTYDPDDIRNLGLKKRCFNILRRNGITKISDLVDLYQKQGLNLIKQIRYLGPLSYQQIGDVLLHWGLITSYESKADEAYARMNSRILHIEIGKGNITFWFAKTTVVVLPNGKVHISSQVSIDLSEKPLESGGIDVLRGRVGRFSFEARDIDSFGANG